MKSLMTITGRLLPWCKSIALAYWHLPLVLSIGLALGYPNWEWFMFVALIPWVGMVMISTIPVCLIAVVYLYVMYQDQSPAWITSDVSWIILIAGTGAVFLPLYWFALSGAVRPGIKRRSWRNFLIAWTILGNLMALFFCPRGM